MKNKIFRRSLIFIFIFEFLELVYDNILFSQVEELEDMLDSESEYSDYQQLLDHLNDLRSSPLNINQADLSDLCSLPWIDEKIARNIIVYRKRYGEFRQISDITYVDGIDQKLLHQLKYYIAVHGKSRSPSFTGQFRTRISGNFERNAGFIEKKYYNSPFKSQALFKIKYSNFLAMGLLTEKDPGEKRINDLLVSYLKINDKYNNQLIFGNYKLEFGQGLVFSNIFSVNKSLSPIKTVKLVEKGIAPYSSVDENKSLFGVAGQFCFKIVQLILFYSYNKLDATISMNNQISNIYNTGYHRNEFELEKKDRIREQIAGFACSIHKNEYLKMSLIYYKSMYNKEMINLNTVSNRFGFTGKMNYLIGINGTINFEDFTIFGEIARSANGAFGKILGLTYSINNNIEIISMYRNYNQEFISRHAYALSERSGNPSNETGYYIGSKIRLNTNVTMGLYYDLFKFPWRTYFEQVPWTGDELLVKMNVHLRNELQVKLFYKEKNRSNMLTKLNDFGIDMQCIEENISKRIGIKLCYQQTKYLRHSFHIQKKSVMKGGINRGLLIYQDLCYKRGSGFSLYLRFSFFDTDGYDSCVYQYENDLPGILTNKMFYGKGNRLYLLINYKFMKSLSVSFKYGISRYEGVSEVGTGYNSIKGDRVRSYGLQVEKNF